MAVKEIQTFEKKEKRNFTSLVSWGKEMKTKEDILNRYEPGKVVLGRLLSKFKKTTFDAKI